MKNYICIMSFLLLYVLFLTPFNLHAQSTLVCVSCEKPLLCKPTSPNNKAAVCESCMIDFIRIHDYAILFNFYSKIMPNEAQKEKYLKLSIKLMEKLTERKKQNDTGHLLNPYMGPLSCDFLNCTCERDYIDLNQTLSEETILQRTLQKPCNNCKGICDLTAVISQKVSNSAIYCVSCWESKVHLMSANNLVSFLKQTGFDLEKKPQPKYNAELVKLGLNLRKDLYLKEKQTKLLPLSLHAIHTLQGDRFKKNRLR